MRIPFLSAYILVMALLLWSGFSTNLEFLFYGITVIILIGLLHYGDRHLGFSSPLLWGFNLWIVLHILGGLLPVGDSVLYSLVLIELVGAPYSILKYDQLVHVYCYFIVALLMWRLVVSINQQAPFVTLATVTVLAASGIGSINEIIEFLATVFIADTNVGGYVNTALDIVANFIGAGLAVFFFRRPAAASAEPAS